MERCSYFIEEKALFGSFPNDKEVTFLENEGVKYFIDLTEYKERNTNKYTTNGIYIKYPIKDRSIPTDRISFLRFIIKLTDIIKDLKTGEKIYIHCKGGHGRSGIVVAAILAYYFSLEPQEALKMTGFFHSKRVFMREKWRKIGSPQTKEQKDFVMSLFPLDKNILNLNDTVGILYLSTQQTKQEHQHNNSKDLVKFI